MKKIILLIFLMIIFSSFTSAALSDFNGNLYFYYSSEEGGSGSTAIDRSNTRNGTYTGGNTRSGDAKDGSFAYFFDDGTDDYIDTEYSENNFDQNSDWTCASWYKSSTTGQWQTIFATYNSWSAGDWIVAIDGITNDLTFRANSGSTDLHSGVQANTGSYQSVFFVHDGTSDRFELWQDGVLRINSTTGMGNGGGVDDLYIGRYVVAEQEFIGVIDEVACWNTKVYEFVEWDNSGAGTFYPFTPPSLYIDNSTLNMTSDGGCIVWRTDKTSICNTTDTTPTMVFDTNKNANCSLRTITHDYNSSFDCGTTGGTSHVCTIFNVDALSFGLNNLIASCAGGGENDTTGNMVTNLTVDSCTYTSGDWTIIDDCTIQTDTTVDALSDILVTGTVINNASITETGAFTNSGTFTNSGEGAVN